MLKQKLRSMNVQRKGPLHCGVYAVNIAPLLSINNLYFCFESVSLWNIRLVLQDRIRKEVAKFITHLKLTLL